jgi:dTDP-4-amino-4,6-dideoxygalactose transaminase
MEYKIPLFDLNFDEAEERAVVDTLRSKWISTGPKTAEFESKFASMLNVPHAVALANCTVALHLAMKLVGIHAGDEVICPSLTFVATANAIRYVDAVPVFADITSYEDLTIDPLDIEKKISKKTKAIVVMHYGGFACDMDRIMAIAKKHELKVIEDACHGPMSEYKGKKLGTIGDIGCFSFFSNKNISTGEGGMLVTNNSEYFERAKLLRSHGMTSLSYERAKGHSTSYDVVDLGYNYRMDDIRASIGITQLDKLEKEFIKRDQIRID